MGSTPLKIAALAWFFVCYFASSNLEAQTVPSSAEPQRLEKRFKKSLQPKSVLETTIPESKKPASLEEMEKIRFVLKKIHVEGSTVYAQHLFHRWQKKLLDKTVSLASIYRFAEKITQKYRDDGYLLSRAIVVPQQIENGEVTI